MLLMFHVTDVSHRLDQSGYLISALDHYPWETIGVTLKRSKHFRGDLELGLRSQGLSRKGLCMVRIFTYI